MANSTIKGWKITLYANGGLDNPVMIGYQNTPHPNIIDGFIIAYDPTSSKVCQGMALSQIEAFRIEPYYDDESQGEEPNNLGARMTAHRFII